MPIRVGQIPLFSHCSANKTLMSSGNLSVIKFTHLVGTMHCERLEQDNDYTREESMKYVHCDRSRATIQRFTLLTAAPSPNCSTRKS